MLFYHRVIEQLLYLTGGSESDFNEFRYTFSGTAPVDCSDGFAAQTSTEITIPYATTTLNAISCDTYGNASVVATRIYIYDYKVSCLAILNDNPSVPDGTYSIDPDGAGRNPPVSVECDMAQVGWTIIHKADFESGDSSGWHDGTGVPKIVNTVSNCIPVITHILGGHNALGRGPGTVQTFDLLNIPHTEVFVSMDAYAFDTWDGESVYFEVDNVSLYQFSHHLKDATSNICGSGWNDRPGEYVEIQTAHTNNDVAVKIRSSFNQSRHDESYAVDNIIIKIR